MSDHGVGGDGGGNNLSNRDVITLPDTISLSDSDSEEEPNNVPFDPEVEDLSSSADDDDEEEDMLQGSGGGAPGAPPFHLAAGPQPVRGEPQNPFSLRGGSSSFSDRSRSIFDCLDSAAKLASSHLGQDNVIDGVFARPPPPPPLVVGGKRPCEAPGQPSQKRSPGVVDGEGGGRVSDSSSSTKRGGGVPDYLVHPERWTCYSLEDVPETSDSRNNLVAQQYVASLQQRKQQQEEEEQDSKEPLTPNLAFNQGQSGCSSSQHKIIFSRPSKAAGKEQAPEEMKTGGGREKSLSHLEQDEGEEEEEKEVKRAKEKAKGVSLFDPAEEEEEGMRSPRVSVACERKRKWGPPGGVDEGEKPPLQVGKPGFVSFRKINRKNFRKTSEQED